MEKNIYIGIVGALVALIFVLVLRRNEPQTTSSDAVAPTPTSYIAPTPAITGDWNYDGVVNEQDESLTSH